MFRGTYIDTVPQQLPSNPPRHSLPNPFLLRAALRRLKGGHFQYFQVTRSQLQLVISPEARSSSIEVPVQPHASPRGLRLT